MTEVLVRLIRDDEEIDAVRALCQQWLDWHWENYPTDWPKGPDHPMDLMGSKEFSKTFQTCIDDRVAAS